MIKLESLDKAALQIEQNLAEKRKLEAQINEVCVKNWEELILPALVEYDEFMKYLSKITEESVLINAELYVCHDEHRYYGIRMTNTYFRGGMSIRFSRSSMYTAELHDEPEDKMNWHGEGSTSDALIENVKANVLQYNNITADYSPLLINEDACNALLNAVDTLFMDRFKAWSERFEKKNQTLAEEIAKLAGTLASAHVPKHNEDGTVEVYLSGKKFVGKLMEE